MTIDQLRKALALSAELGQVIANTQRADPIRMVAVEHHHEWMENNLRAELAEQEKAALLQRFTHTTA